MHVRKQFPLWGILGLCDYFQLYFPIFFLTPQIFQYGIKGKNNNNLNQTKAKANKKIRPMFWTAWKIIFTTVLFWLFDRGCLVPLCTKENNVQKQVVYRMTDVTGCTLSHCTYMFFQEREVAPWCVRELHPALTWKYSCSHWSKSLSIDLLLLAQTGNKEID